MKPSLIIKLKGTGGYKKNRYLYGGTGGISSIQYDTYIPYDSSNIMYDGTYNPIVRHLYGSHICYGGDGGQWFNADNQPQIDVKQTKTQTQREVINKPQLNIL